MTVWVDEHEADFNESYIVICRDRNYVNGHSGVWRGDATLCLSLCTLKAVTSLVKRLFGAVI